MGVRPLEIFYFFQCGNRFYMSEYYIYGRQIQTYKDEHRAERVKAQGD